MLGMGLFALGILVALPLVSAGLATDTSGLWIAGAEENQLLLKILRRVETDTPTTQKRAVDIPLLSITSLILAR